MKAVLVLVALVIAGCGPAQQLTAAPAGGSLIQLQPVSGTPEPTAPAVPAPTAEPTAEPSAVPPITTPAPTPTAPGGGLPASLRGTEWTRLPTRTLVVALTFDAGANADGVPSILATLAARGVPATFFLTGRWAQTYPALAKRIGASYAVGNHSYDHPYLTHLSDAAVRDEITAGGAAVGHATNTETRPLFRFPYGSSDARTIAIANGLGYGCIRWTVDTIGWRGLSGGQSAGSVMARVLANLQPGEIILMHVGSAGDGSTLDADALPTIITELGKRGYAFVTIPQMLS